jgi:hypothetical protein
MILNSEIAIPNKEEFLNNQAKPAVNFLNKYKDRLLSQN